ncbi:CHAT domain-containing protein [Aquincola sp. S2]|uniref:CHAT domain-containing protein n=1 Tax=Pseudaquabacterium terrae TaxID=2732868 RepID=A0ABX2ERS4_9BURK|nr:CHAT domain-containing protein [Aquabacterium terrae]NRF71216.1 CHAT domain-containing protein [Aquabacterium terrae]
MPAKLTSTTIEFHRFGGEGDVLLKDKKYIRTCGYQKAAEEVAVRIDPKEFRRNLNRLRYDIDRTPETVAAAKTSLGKEADYFLAQSQRVPGRAEALHQLDIVTHASELRAYPFEALYATLPDSVLASAESGVILTRRIRSNFSEEVPPWPEMPSVLFVHAELAHDLSQDLVDKHVRALTQALAPWGNASTLEKKSLLVVQAIDSIAKLGTARARGKFSYIHVLAHGARVDDEGLDESECEWGLRLGQPGSQAVSAEEIARALQPQDQHPLVVTLAACDSGNADRTELGNSSLVETLHRNGIPVVIGSQFPLTKPGSVTLAEVFYRELLSGGDVRIALHAARVALRQKAREAKEAEHDWLSLVGYVRLPPEGYSHYLEAFSLRVQLRMLEAARNDAEALFSGNSSPVRDDLDRIGDRLQERIAQLQAQFAGMNDPQQRAVRAECVGLLASANKSLAELRFMQAACFPADREELQRLSREALQEAVKWYGQAYLQDLSRHWQGMQKLALEMALTGQLANPVELMFVRHAARNAIDLDPKEYWACGTLAEAIMLESLTTGPTGLADARAALAELRKRSANDPKDQGFAKLSTRRQLRRYMMWWTLANGYFPKRGMDLSGHAADLVQLLGS